MSEENKNNDFTNDSSEESVRRSNKKISLSAFVFSAIALVLAAVMLTYTCCRSFYEKKLSEARLDGVISGSELYSQMELLRVLFEQYSYLDIDKEELIDTVLKAYVDATGDRYARCRRQRDGSAPAHSGTRSS